MASGETLLKITDFPFSYSAIILIFGGLWQVDLQGHNLFIILGTAGALGTFLSIVDPIGRSVRQYLKNQMKNNVKTMKEVDKKALLENSIKALETNAIKVETDKIVSIGYFLIILFLFGMITVQGNMPDNFQLTKPASQNTTTVENTLQENRQTVCDRDCMITIGWIISFPALVVIAIIAQKDWNKLKNEYLETAAIHQMSIGSEYVTENTIVNLNQAIAENDWPTAKEWSKIALDEIKIRKNKMDIIIEAINEVYKPLYEEILRISSTCEHIKETGRYSPIQANVWREIKGRPTQILIDEPDKAEIINNFYEKISKYNTLAIRLENQIKQIILEEARIFFKEDLKQYKQPIQAIRYWLKDSKGRETAPELSELIIRKKHPLEAAGKNSKALFIRFDLENGKNHSLNSDSDFNKFDEFWKLINKKIMEETQYNKMEELFNEIEKDSKELLEFYEKEIRKQWRF